MTHGFGAHRAVMWPLCARLRRMGYSVENWGYHSLLGTCAKHGAALRARIDQLQAAGDRLHIVAHSMGNILTRAALDLEGELAIERIVMICPPNHGSHVASLYAPLFGRICGTLADITDREDSFVRTLSDDVASKFQVGIIQASSDFVVREPSTHLANVQHYVKLRGFHSSVLWKPQIVGEIDHFLQQGCFTHDARNRKEHEPDSR